MVAKRAILAWEGAFAIRRAAAERRIPCFTSIDTARVAVDALASASRPISVEPLPECLKGLHGGPK